MTEKKQNTVKELVEYFSTPEKPVKSSEFAEFWKSCSDEEKEYFKNADLGK